MATPLIKVLTETSTEVPEFLKGGGGGGGGGFRSDGNKDFRGGQAVVEEADAEDW